MEESCSYRRVLVDMDVTLQRCRKWVEDALEFCDGTHDWEDIENGINKGTMQLQRWQHNN